eukprot:6463744-Amphidinium_carterae.1
MALPNRETNKLRIRRATHIQREKELHGVTPVVINGQELHRTYAEGKTFLSISAASPGPRFSLKTEVKSRLLSFPGFLVHKMAAMVYVKERNSFIQALFKKSAIRCPHTSRASDMLSATCNSEFGRRAASFSAASMG